MSGGGGGGDENYWPAFVDALSNVVLTLVFVLVVFVFALVLASNKVENKAMEMVRQVQEQAQKGQDFTQVDELRERLKVAEEKVATLSKELAQTSSSLEESATIASGDKGGLRAIGAVSVLRAGNRITIVFPKAISDLDDASIIKLEQAFAGVKSGKRILIQSSIGLESYSAARRLAYYRILGLRNHLLNHKEFKDAVVENKIISPKEPQDGRVELFFD